MNDAIRTGRVKLAEAAWRHTANPDDGREWQTLHERRRADALPEADHHRFLELNGRMIGEVRDRLASGEWVAWGWQEGSATPFEIPIELFERADIRINVESNILRCDVCAFDNVTVDVTMTSVPSVDAQTVKAPAAIKAKYDKWTATLPLPPTQRDATRFAKDNRLMLARVMELWEAGPKRPIGRTPNDLK